MIYEDTLLGMELLRTLSKAPTSIYNDTERCRIGNCCAPSALLAEQRLQLQGRKFVRHIYIHSGINHKAMHKTNHINHKANLISHLNMRWYELTAAAIQYPSLNGIKQKGSKDDKYILCVHATLRLNHIIATAYR